MAAGRRGWAGHHWSLHGRVTVTSYQGRYLKDTDVDEVLQLPAVLSLI